MSEAELDGGSVLLTVEEAMRVLRVRSRNTMWLWERAGHLRPVHVGRPDAEHRTLRYRRSDLLALVGGKHGR